MAELAEWVGPEQAERYRRCVSQAKEEARNGNLEESIRLFREAHDIQPSGKLMAKVQKLEEALASLALDQEDDDFVNVCQSGLMLFREMHEKLFDHQREGIAFLYSLYRDGRKGGILADDMGLGKTVQIIAFLSGMFDGELIRSVLLVMPTTLVSNWVREFTTWAPGLRVKVFHGTSKVERTRNLERIQARNGVLITSYQMILNNWQQLSSCRGKEFVWDYVILDEAHKIKSPSAKTTKCMHAIPSQNRILLTGTPVQNNLQELWALFDFACQGSLLGTMKTFRMEYENPITKAREKDATPGEKALGLKISENLMSIIKPYFLRRSKDDLQKKLKSESKSSRPEDQNEAVAPEMPSLPRKNDFIVWVYVSRIQEEIYRNFLSLEHIKELLMTTRSPLAELNILKKLCDHPRLLSARACSQLGLATSEYSEREDGGENEAEELWGQNMNIDHISDEFLIEESGKVKFLITLLDRLQAEGHQTLVFSQSRKMLDIIERILIHKRFKLMRIDGTVTHLSEREKRIDAFQNNRDYSVFLLTTQVGGVGLTLTAATRVVIFDPSWNPATDAQAVDRAYRIGQKENVVIYRLITCGTVEEKIYRRQVFKESLIRQTTGDKKNPYRYFTKQELRELFTLGDVRSSTTQLQLQSLHGTQRKTDVHLDEHIAYLYSLEIFGLSDHDLMYTRETGHEDKAEDEEAHRYIEHRVQKAQELMQLESQLKDQLAASIQHTTEGAWLRVADPSSLQPRKKSPKRPPVYSAPSPVPVPPPNSGDVIHVESDHEEDLANASFKMASLVIENVGDESLVQEASSMDVSLSKTEEPRHASMQEDEPKQDLSSSPVRFVSNEEEDSSGSKTTTCDPPASSNNSFQEASSMDGSLSKTEEPRRASLQEDEPKQDLSSSPVRFVSNEEEDSSGSKTTTCDPPASSNNSFQEASSMDGSLSKTEEPRRASLQEDEPKQDLSSSPVRFVSNEEEDSSGSKTTTCDPPASSNNSFNNSYMEDLQRSIEYFDDDDDDDVHEAEAKTETSLDVSEHSCKEASPTGELDAVSPSVLQASGMSQRSTNQKSGRSESLVRAESLLGSSLYQADFNLLLEDSENPLEDASEREMLLEDTENTGFQLRLDSRCSSAARSRTGEKRSCRSFQSSKNTMGSLMSDTSNAAQNASMDDSDVVAYKKKPGQRILSDSEEDKEDPVIYLGESERGNTFPLDHPNRNCASTPTSGRPLADFCFSPHFNRSERRSTASRRSLASVVFDQVEDVAEDIASASTERPFLDDLEALIQELSGRDSAESEEESLGETLSSEGKSNYLSAVDSSG